MERIGRIILYIALLVLDGLLYYFLHSHFYFTLLVMMIIAPIASIIVVYYVRYKVGVNIECVETSNCKEEFTLTIKVENKTVFAIMDTRLLIGVENQFFKTRGEKELFLPLRAIHGNTISIPIMPSYAGIVKIEIKNIKIKDYMGFIILNKNVDISKEITIFPEYVKKIDIDNVGLDQGMLESEESNKRGNDFSDVQEIREYIPGDKLNNIHWKLTAKRDILMVKDRVSMSDAQMAIVIELCNNNNSELNTVLSMAYTLIRKMVEDNTTVRLLYWSEDKSEYEDTRIDYKEDINLAFQKLFYEETYNNPILASMHMRDVHPEMKSYIHIMGSNGNANVYIRENE